MEFSDLTRILDLARAHAVAELELVYPGGRIRFRRAGEGLAPPAPVSSPSILIEAPSIAPAGTAHDEAIRLAELHDDGRLHLVRASSVGLFSPLEEADESLCVGSRVTAGAPLGAIKSLGMKRSVIAPVSGVVAAVYVRPGDPLQYGHLIVGIEV